MSQNIFRWRLCRELVPGQLVVAFMMSYMNIYRKNLSPLNDIDTKSSLAWRNLSMVVAVSHRDGVFWLWRFKVARIEEFKFNDETLVAEVTP